MINRRLFIAMLPAAVVLPRGPAFVQQAGVRPIKRIRTAA
jgi:hypothetical protein